MIESNIQHLPPSMLSWPFYGAGLENMGQDGHPVDIPVPQPAPNQLLARVDACGLCFSDIKVIKQGGEHPRLHHRDLKKDPTVLGHEVSLTVAAVGEDLKNRFHPGQRLALQPDIYYHGQALAYGYIIPGGLQEYCLLGAEVLEGDAGCYALPITPELGYAEVALTEPWACVEAAYTQRRRVNIKPGGVLWIIGQAGDETDYQLGDTFSAGLPSRVILTDVPQSLASQLAGLNLPLVVRDSLSTNDFPLLAQAYTQTGFNDILCLGPVEAGIIEAAAKLAAPCATVTLVGPRPLSRPVSIDLGRIHYDYIAYLGAPGPDIGAAYSSTRSRSELRSGGRAWILGAGGPMGRMHLQRMIQMPSAPGLVLASDIDTPRLDDLKRSFGAQARLHGLELVTLNTKDMSPAALEETLRRIHGGRGFDDIVAMVPLPALIEGAMPHLAPDGMLVLFAGIARGTYASLDLSGIYLGQVQLTGTTGSNIQDQLNVLHKTETGELSPADVVAAIGGIDAAQEGMRAMLESRYPGKVVIYPQVRSFPLTGLADLKNVAPAVTAKLGPGGVWTCAAEAEFLRLYSGVI